MSEGPLHPANETKSVIDTIHRTTTSMRVSPNRRTATGDPETSPRCRATLWMTTWTPRGVTVGDDGRLGLDPWQEESVASPP